MNALSAHLLNLRRNATPFFFNTLFEPYEEGSDFVRGYPFSLWQGVPTVISHGLWLDAPDYDAPTQLLKPFERNFRYVDASVTVCLLYTSPSPRDQRGSRMPSSA